MSSGPCLRGAKMREREEGQREKQGSGERAVIHDRSSEEELHFSSFRRQYAQARSRCDFVARIREVIRWFCMEGPSAIARRRDNRWPVKYSRRSQETEVRSQNKVA